MFISNYTIKSNKFKTTGKSPHTENDHVISETTELQMRKKDVWPRIPHWC